MAPNRMLIDAAHPEETRVVVTRGNRIEEFDFESASRKQLRGNIYLAKVTRVEPSLQAAFVDYGGNRHGFLAFSEIHPDYYQIPVADRQALLEDEARAAEEEDEDEERGRKRGRGSRGKERRRRDDAISAPAEGEATAGAAETVSDDVRAGDTDPHAENGSVRDSDSDHDETDDEDEEEVVEQIGGGDALEDMQQRPVFRPRKHYKIQEVIKRRQIMLVQVVKEERGTKGAALTTYLSLAGRYSVLMPNTARGGGISRKITSAADRKRLKELVGDLDVPDGMGVILRTAGASRTKPEIKRDFEYLLRMWEQVRETTLTSVAPTLVYEEGSLIKRAIRDLYSKDIEEIVVAGDQGYSEAKAFMKMLMPSQGKSVKAYRDLQPIFTRSGVETQLDAMFNNVVNLKSGGYIVINPTEALVSIDVNSGRATREHNIEDTALKTNLEAAEEVARQLRLRDLAGLIVIDFIDMEEKRNNRHVEKRLKDCLKNDRARIQVGRISHFGLMEMSRQRMRTGVLESSTTPCTHCAGTGSVRATPSVALHILRQVEDQLLKNAQYNLTIRTRTETAFYILNQKRSHLRGIEERFGIEITVLADDTLIGPQHSQIERGELAPNGGLRVEMLPPPPVEEEDDDVIVEEEAEDDTEAVEASEASDRERAADDGDERGDGRRRKRRRRRRGGRDRDGDGDEPRVAAAEETATAGDETDSDDEGDSEEPDGDAGEARGANGDGEARDGDGRDGGRRRRRRGRRGGRRNRGENGAPLPGAEDQAPAIAAVTDGAPAVVLGEEVGPPPPAFDPPMSLEPVAASAEKPKRGGRRRKAEPEAAESAVAATATTDAQVAEPVAAEKPKRGRAKKAAAAVVPVPADEVAADPVADLPPLVPQTPMEPPARAALWPEAASPDPVPPAPPAAEPEPEEVEDPNRPKRSGWWSKAKKAFGG